MFISGDTLQVYIFNPPWLLVNLPMEKLFSMRMCVGLSFLGITFKLDLIVVSFEIFYLILYMVWLWRHGVSLDFGGHHIIVEASAFPREEYHCTPLVMQFS